MQQLKALEHEADLAVAHARALVVGQALDVRAVEPVLARRRRVEAAEDVEQRRLARSRRADDRDHLAAIDRERHAIERRDALVAHRVVARDVHELDQGRHARRKATPPSRGGGDESRDSAAKVTMMTRTACVILRSVSPSILSTVSVGW